VILELAAMGLVAQVAQVEASKDRERDLAQDCCYLLHHMLVKITAEKRQPATLVFEPSISPRLF